MKKFPITSTEIECKIADYFGIRTHLIVPNVSWGLGVHECDLLVLSKNGYATEVEIKISASDLKADALKGHGHKSKKIKYLYFAIPSYLCKYIEFIPRRAGILVITSAGRVFCAAEPEQNRDARSLTLQEQYDMARLGALRIWSMKNTIINNSHDRKYLLSKIKELTEIIDKK